MTTTYKPPRFGPQLLARAADPQFLDQTHVVFGGTGAVGGAAVLHLVSVLEEARAHLLRRGASPLPSPCLVVTGRSKQELRQFTRLLFELQRRDHGAAPERLAGEGYRTVGGVTVELCTFAVDPSLPDISGFAQKDEGARRDACVRFLERSGLSLTDSPAADKAGALEAALRAGVGRPFSAFLRRYREQHGAPRGRFRSVVVSIPLASLAAYKLTDLEQAGPWLGVEQSDHLEELKDLYLRAIRDDLAETAEELAEEVLAAHTTAVGGMYDVEADGSRRIRLGFAHSALDDRLRKKQEFADKLTRLYAEKHIKMLITAAAIGVDAVLVRKTPPWNGGIRAQLAKAAADGTPVVPAAHLTHVHVYPPADVDLLDEPPGPVAFEHGQALVLGHVLKSGENGFFSVPNADALYRVMRVTSSSELGLLLARTALLGDDRNCPAFPDNVCYYRESDNSRQVFDLLDQPELRRNQLAGLEPKALQDLGSAKHQAELHLLGLLILLQRLKTLDFDALPRHVDLARFDPGAFFESHSKALTLEQAAAWDAHQLARELRLLAGARQADDLAPLVRHALHSDPTRQAAAQRVLRAALHAVWAIPSLGTPLVYVEHGRRRACLGPYVASLDRVLTGREVVGRHLRARFEARGGGPPDALERLVEFHVANNGFLDLRPLAVLVTAKSDSEDLDGRVQVFGDEASLADALGRLEPYSYFTTSGLIALLVRLRGLARLAAQLDLRLGSANEFRAHFPRDERGHALLMPGVVEAFRMVSEGLEKTTGLERLDGRWGYAPI